jgi:transposase
MSSAASTLCSASSISMAKNFVSLTGTSLLRRSAIRVVARLMTVPGIDVTVAVSVIAAVGDFSRFSSPGQLVSYLGLNPTVRQSGEGPANHGRITKAGRSQARGMIVEAAFSAARTAGPLRAFYTRIKGRRGFQIATVATARKMLVLCWYLVAWDEDYAFSRPGLNARKRRHREREFAVQQERAYELTVSGWQDKKTARSR